MPPITLLCNTTGNNSFTRGISITFGTLVKCDQQHRRYASAYQLACDNELQILMHSSQQLYDNTRKPRKGAAVIAASMHGFASCRKFKSPMTLTLDRVKVISTYAVYVGLTAYPTM